MTIIKHTKYKVCCYGSYKCYYLKCNRRPIFILCFENFTINSLSNLNTTLQQTAKRISQFQPSQDKPKAVLSTMEP